MAFAGARGVQTVPQTRMLSGGQPQFKQGRMGSAGTGGSGSVSSAVSRPSPLAPPLPPPPGGGGGGGGGGGWEGGYHDPTAGTTADPEFGRATTRAEDYLGELKSGTGYAMDVMQGGMQSQIDSDVERARESAASQGIPFDEAAYRRQANVAMQGGLAQEKLGREKMYGEQMAGLQGVIAGGAENKLAKSGQGIQKYGIDVNRDLEMYKTAMGALQQWLQFAFND